MQENSREIFTAAIFGLARLMVTLGVVLFAPAWTFNYWQAWVYLLLFGSSSALITGYLWKKDPHLLVRRLNAGPRAEQEKSQRRIQLLAALAFLSLMIVPSLDHRFSWSKVPLAIVTSGDLLVALGFLMVFLVFRANTFASATISIAADQRVISTGPYAVIRHPMYGGALVMLLGTPLALGSWWGLLMFVPMVGVIAHRAVAEEAFLARNLPGYDQYCLTVKYRLAPLIW